MTTNEDRYESIEMIIKSREDGVSWFDYFFDLITENCQGKAESDENDCTCGLETLGGSGGTLDQCHEYQTNIVAGISPLMVAQAITFLVDGTNSKEQNKLIDKIVKWAREEIRFEEYFENREWENEEEDDEEPVTFETIEEAIDWLKGEE